MANISGAGTPLINAVQLKQQAADPTAPSSTYSKIYDKNGGIYHEHSDSTVTQVPKVAKVALAAADTGGGVLSWANPESGSIIITKLVIDVTTIAAAACSLDFGTTATNGTTQSDNLIDGLDVHSSTGTFSTIDQAGANGKERQKLATGKWVTGSKDSGAAASLVGSAYISYYLA